MKRLVRNAVFQGAGNRQSLYDLTIPENWNGRLIVFMHGYMGYKDWGAWNLVESFFVNNQYGFLKYNVSHNGGTIDNPIDFSDLEAFSQNSYTKEIQDFEAILNVIEDEFREFPDICLIGHSRGGGIALLQSDVGHVTKICTWAAIASIEKRFPTGRELEEWKEDGFYYRKNGRTHQTMPHKYNQYEDYVANQERLNIKSYCLNSTKPTCIIHGNKDTSVLIEEGELISEWLGTELNVIDGEQHTFGSKQPWESDQLPEGLANVCNTTLNFFNSNEQESAPSKKEKLSLLTELVKMAKSDDQLRDIEFQFLQSIATQLGVTTESFEKIFNENIEFHPPKIELDRIVQFQRLVMMMNIDSETNDEEMKLIRDLAIRMGLHHNATEEVLKLMHNYPTKIVPTHLLLKVFKTFHN